MMKSTSSKSAEDIQGFEFDWLGCDEAGCVALFSTGGAGYAPAEFLRDTDAHHNAIQAVLALPAITEAQFAPDMSPTLQNTWKLVAERGLYAYDFDPSGGPYQLVAAPVTPLHARELPAAIAEVVSRLKLTMRFARSSVVTDQALRGAL
jgi:hypothetical protein